MSSQPGADTHARHLLLKKQAVDPRADGATRMIHVDTSGVTIERVLRGVRMRIGIPVAAYQGLFLAVRHPIGTATLTLRHDDTDLDVELGGGEAIALARKARAWGRLLDQPVAIEEACIKLQSSLERRTKRAAPSRRSRFARRRKLGRAACMATSFAHEHEIIARD